MGDPTSRSAGAAGSGAAPEAGPAGPPGDERDAAGGGPPADHGLSVALVSSQFLQNVSNVEFTFTK